MKNNVFFRIRLSIFLTKGKFKRRLDIVNKPKPQLKSTKIHKRLTKKRHEKH